MKKALGDLWKEPWGKVVIVATVVIVGIIIYRLAVRASAAIKQAKANKVVTDELVNLQQAGQNLSYTPATYAQLADTLHNAMVNFADKAAIGNVFSQMNNNSDVLKLISDFGFRPYYCIWPFPCFDDKNLNQWINTKLNASDKEQFVNGPLKQKNITILF